MQCTVIHRAILARILITGRVPDSSCSQDHNWPYMVVSATLSDEMASSSYLALHV